jgi:DHA1 family bicyclomycin/chloramphenicol resistance-like MFS transporter
MPLTEASTADYFVLINPTKPLPMLEFVTLMALLTSLVALSIDAMLPALAIIGSDLGAVRENDRQLVLGVLFFGLAAGQLIFGPVSDSTGRKPVIFVGVSLFVIGCLVSAFAESFTGMLVGRFLQGVGAAAPRNVGIAVIRDCYKGDAMAQIMSLIMSIFILVPMAAPALGQGILWVADWRAIFIAMLILAVLAQIWFTLRQPETLPREKRRIFSARHLWRAFCEVCSNRVAVAYTLAASLIFGAFVGYLTSSQQIFQEQYRTGEWFAFYFALVAGSLGLASYANSRLVVRYGMKILTLLALIFLSTVSGGFFLLALAFEGHPPFELLLLYLMVGFFPVGVLFGNLKALAMESLGHIAGKAAAVIGSITTHISLFLGSLIGQAYDGTVLPLAAGFAGLGTLSLGICLWVQKGR